MINRFKQNTQLNLLNAIASISTEIGCHCQQGKNHTITSGNYQNFGARKNKVKTPHLISWYESFVVKMIWVNISTIKTKLQLKSALKKLQEKNELHSFFGLQRIKFDMHWCDVMRWVMTHSVQLRVFAKMDETWRTKKPSESDQIWILVKAVGPFRIRKKCYNFFENV